MFPMPSNYIAVVVAAILNMVLGYVWYGPLFGNMWMKLTGRTKESMKGEKDQMPMVMGSMFLGALVMAYVLAVFVKMAGAGTIAEGAMVGFWAWFGFVATVMLQDVLYEKKNKQLASINLGYNLVALLINGAVLAMMP